VITAAFLVGLLAAPLAPAAASAGPVVAGSRYLALGDSVTFGYQENFVVPAPNYNDPASFVGYPEQLGAELHLIVSNPACPGETSASLINSSAPSNGCENGYRNLHPLHVHYKGSQLAYAVAYLRAHPGVALVSLMIGANDLFLCQNSTADGCRSPSELNPTLAKIRHNVHRILTAIRRKAHYRGQLVIVNYYSLNYASTFLSGVSIALDKAQDTAARPFHVQIADGYGEFATATRRFGGSLCLAGLLTLKQAGTAPSCGIHPSYAGQALLAQALEKALHL
jgi:lysophospholipase L1-like esterase